MLLQDYRMKVAKLSREKAGAQIGVNGITIWRWETGRSIPPPELLRKVQEWSAGAVTPNDFIAPLPAAKKASKRVQRRGAAS